MNVWWMEQGRLENRTTGEVQSAVGSKRRWTKDGGMGVGSRCMESSGGRRINNLLIHHLPSDWVLVSMYEACLSESR